MKVRVFFHDKCFDGACSAALFSRFYRERIREDVDFQFSGLVHRAGALFDESQFNGDENAIVDFKYSRSDKITWWFDHHQSAFLTPEDAAHFEQQQSNRKFYDPDFKSCTKFIATIARDQFGFKDGPVADLIEWADIIDGAQFPDPQMAVEMREAVAKLTEKWRKLDHELGFAIGIANGFATLGRIGFEGRFDYAAIGTVVNLAERLCEEAKSGEILVEAKVQAAIEDVAHAVSVSELLLKNFQRPVRVFTVTALRT